MTLNTPGGMPARSASSASASAENGVWLAGRITTVQPAASPGPALRVIMAVGKFHGVIAATTPTGSFITMMRRPFGVLRDGVAVDALALLGEPLDEARGVGDLALALGERLALLGGHDGGEVVGVGQHQVVPACAGSPRAPWRASRARPATPGSPPRSPGGSRPRPAPAPSPISSPVAGLGTWIVLPLSASHPFAVDAVGLPEQARVLQRQRGGRVQHGRSPSGTVRRQAASRSQR